jgi:hypothetical protein
MLHFDISLLHGPYSSQRTTYTLEKNVLFGYLVDWALHFYFFAYTRERQLFGNPFFGSKNHEKVFL